MAKAKQKGKGKGGGKAYKKPKEAIAEVSTLDGAFTMEPAKAENSAFKMAGYGFPGSGKSFSASSIVIGAYIYLKCEKPVAVLDTENASDFLIPHYEHNGIEVVRKRTRAFSNLIPFVEYCNKNCSFGIIDSLTHFWIELCDSYGKAMGRDNLQFNDWKYLKGEFSEFMKVFLNAPAHLILLGRGGYEYSYETDSDGKKVLVKTGTKMKSESETAFEPHLTVEMERLQWTEAEMQGLIAAAKEGRNVHVSGKVSFYKMTVLKDRGNVFTGSSFIFNPQPGKMIEPDNPVWESIKPYFDILNLGAEQGQIDNENSVDTIRKPDKSGYEYHKQREMYLDEVNETLNSGFPGSSAMEKACKLELCNFAFGTASKKRMETFSIDKLKLGRDLIADHIKTGAEIEARLLNELEVINYPLKTDPKRLQILAKTGQELKFRNELKLWQAETATANELKSAIKEIEAVKVDGENVFERVAEIAVNIGMGKDPAELQEFIETGNAAGALQYLKEKAIENFSG